MFWEKNLENIAQGKTTESIYIAKYLCISLHWVWFECVLKSKDVRGAAKQYWWHSTHMYNVTYSQWGSKSLSSCILNFHGATKARSLLEHSCAILISFKILVSFNITSTDFVLMSADVVLKMTKILKEMRVVQLCYKSERTLFLQKFSIFFILLKIGNVEDILWNFRNCRDILVYQDQKL